MEYKLYKSKVAPTYISETQTVLSSYYILANKNGTLWFNRANSEILYLPIKDLSEFELICKVYGYIGKFQINSNSSGAKIIFVKNIEEVCKITLKSKEHSIYKIKQILVLPLNLSEEEFQLEFEIGSHMGSNDQSDFQKSTELIKSLINRSTKNNSSDKSSNIKVEKKILEEVYKIFQENNGSFYLSNTFDLTNSIERQHSNTYDEMKPIWKRAENRFFWNWPLISNIVNLETKCDDSFIIPIIQGFVQTDNVNIDSRFLNNESEEGLGQIEFNTLKICLISRRSRYRLGTRFKKRGIDEDGNVANFIETEQIVELFNGHLLSFVIIRGSIPCFWNQPSYNYRPAPQINKSFSENKTAFRKHFDQLNNDYPHQKQKVFINLVDEIGKESVLANGFLDLVKDLDNETLTYIHFDFHEHCKGLNYQNVSRLTNRIENIINDMLYCWIDNKGLICQQKIIFRVNCIDCLDRTNVIQSVIAKNVLVNQLRRIGLFGPEIKLTKTLNSTLSVMWCNNGDGISMQYAGTAALKKTYYENERKLAGLINDSLKSANRYYLRFKEHYRQIAYDVLQGKGVAEIINDVDNSSQSNSNNNNNNSIIQSVIISDDNDESQAVREDNIRSLVSDCRKELIDGREDCYGSWALINYADHDPTQSDPDIILVFTGTTLYVSNYDDGIEQIIDYQRIPVENIEKIEIGPETSLFKSTNFDILRIHYRINEESGYFHSFKSSCFRFFNNLVITMKSVVEESESLKGIAQTLKYTSMHFNHDIPLEEDKRLSRKKSKIPNDIISLRRKMTSVDESPIANQTTLKKINSVGKLVGNKLLDFSRKIKIPSPIPIVQQQSSATDATQIPQQKTFSKFYVDDTEKMNENEGILVNFDTSDTFDSIINNDSLLSETISESPVNTNKIINDNSLFYPNVNKKQFLNKNVKLNYLRNYTKDSKTAFIFII